MDNPSTLDIIEMYTNEVIQAATGENPGDFYLEEFKPFGETHGFDIRMDGQFDVVGSIRVRDTGVAVNYAKVTDNNIQRFMDPKVLVFNMGDPDFIEKYKAIIEVILKNAREAYGKN